MTHVGRLRIEDHVGYGDFDFLTCRAELQSHVYAFAILYAEDDPDTHRLFESLCFHAHGVFAYAQVRKHVVAAVARGYGLNLVGRDVSHRNNGAGYGCAGRIVHCADDTCGIDLRGRSGSKTQGHQKTNHVRHYMAPARHPHHASLHL